MKNAVSQQCGPLIADQLGELETDVMDEIGCQTTHERL